MGLLLTISQGVNVIGTIMPPTIAALLALKNRLSGQGTADEPFTVQVSILKDGIWTKIEENDQIIAEWRAANPNV